MKKIGILGGISSASTIQYYKTILDMYYKKFSDYYYPEIIISSLNFQYFTDLENRHKTSEYINYIINGINSLQRSGADFVIMAANSPHSVFHSIKQQIDLPVLSIVDTAAEECSRLKLKKVLLTGIKYTMQSSFYQKGFESCGIEVLTPSEKHQDEINSIIFSELVLNRVTENARENFRKILSSYDVDGVILGCTELPLLLNQKDMKLPLIDTLKLHCKAALSYALVES
ncbi:aspartate/glutamate racemase family protein [Clostridium luticellarii]|jgi:aspartate racemase|uniref:Putative amino-acid racemase n=1 Tax=Clostridium luticellarii TaxID=1691940 RepID=A0A2T0BAR3_9CLOT|nr:amino acid racemase [Clostridium luticellarii]MCI1946455.1 amino acid racemase [Clostridium luticellarii]MCI1967451.1 amino acid racemase [Clostridium luticellarii]MCI1996912.1 amino acid racemase [Clostridium luticellarii]MCI2041042.1 amino acid racemase [Clostridium luticellarii]PRR80932.1 putative amino-acid racemase [Clostridium luticellarii]